MSLGYTNGRTPFNVGMLPALTSVSSPRVFCPTTTPLLHTAHKRPSGAVVIPFSEFPKKPVPAGQEIFSAENPWQKTSHDAERHHMRSAIRRFKEHVSISATSQNSKTGNFHRVADPIILSALFPVSPSSKSSELKYVTGLRGHSHPNSWARCLPRTPAINVACASVFR